MLYVNYESGVCRHPRTTTSQDHSNILGLFAVNHWLSVG